MLKNWTTSKLFFVFVFISRALKNGKLFHSYKNGRSTINAYLEDYALTISAFIRLYEATYDTKWLTHSEKLTEYAIAHFYDTKSGMFFFTSDLDWSGSFFSKFQRCIISLYGVTSSGDVISVVWVLK